MLPLLLAFALQTHEIRPGQNTQAVLDAAQPGDRIVFRQGLHEMKLGRHRAMLYVDKPLDIELEAGATLRLAAGQSKLEKTPEITTDHGAPKTIDDFEAGGDYDLGLGEVIYSIRIDGEGTFTWGSGGTFDFQHAKVPITGDWQELSHGVKVRFPSKTGYSVGSLWFLSYDGPEAYGIRIGHGTQKEYIDGVRIYGRGTIDLNSPNNAQPSGLVKNINACVLVHGRVRNVSIEGITMTNTMRSVMLYGEHTGKFLQGGAVGPGESFDAENITITRTRTINPKGSGYLLGHPSHRGWLRKVRCNENYMETDTTSIEPNFQLDQYEVIGNVIKSNGRAIHCWRRSTNGLVANNVRIDDPTGKEVVMVNAPGAWRSPENIILRDNRNHLSEPLGFWATVGGGQDNRATGAFSAVTGGQANEAQAPYSRAHGQQAVARRTGEDVLAAGAFRSPGDAQTSVLVARGVTTGAMQTALRSGTGGITIPRKATVAFRVLLSGRDERGQHPVAFEAAGVAWWVGEQLQVRTQRITPLVDVAGASLTIAGGTELNIVTQGIAGAEMRWVARVELVEVSY
ncbi:MAG: hypothetical protein JNK87_40645 [Bryobacterales bacterium]|nr:hypothetical protein [Bryobacterales bacterium]